MKLKNKIIKEMVLSPLEELEFSIYKEIKTHYDNFEHFRWEFKKALVNVLLNSSLAWRKYYITKYKIPMQERS